MEILLCSVFKVCKILCWPKIFSITWIEIFQLSLIKNQGLSKQERKFVQQPRGIMWPVLLVSVWGVQNSTCATCGGLDRSHWGGFQVCPIWSFFSGALASILALFSTHFLLISLPAAVTVQKKPTLNWSVHERLAVEFCAALGEQRSVQTGMN